jgi:hypothetical protein
MGSSICAEEVTSGAQESGAVKMASIGVLPGLLTLSGLIRQRDRVRRGGRALGLIRVDGRDVRLCLLLGRVRRLNYVLKNGSNGNQCGCHGKLPIRILHTAYGPLGSRLSDAFAASHRGFRGPRSMGYI